MKNAIPESQRNLKIVRKWVYCIFLYCLYIKQLLTATRDGVVRRWDTQSHSSIRQYNHVLQLSGCRYNS